MTFCVRYSLISPLHNLQSNPPSASSMPWLTFLSCIVGRICFISQKKMERKMQNIYADCVTMHCYFQEKWVQIKVSTLIYNACFIKISHAADQLQKFKMAFFIIHVHCVILAHIQNGTSLFYNSWSCSMPCSSVCCLWPIAGARMTHSRRRDTKGARVAELLDSIFAYLGLICPKWTLERHSGGTAWHLTLVSPATHVPAYVTVAAE